MQISKKYFNVNNKSFDKNSKLYLTKLFKLKSYVTLTKLLFKYIENIIFNLIFSPVIIIIFLSNFFFDIKFGSFQSNRLGQFAEMDNFITLRKKQKKKEINFLSFKKPLANKFLFKMFRREIKFFYPCYFVEKLDRSLKFWSRSSNFSWNFGEEDIF